MEGNSTVRQFSRLSGPAFAHVSRLPQTREAVTRLRTHWYIVIALAVISASVIALERSADDGRYLSVEICVEFESAEAHAEQLGYDSLESYLVALKESGVVSVGVSELTLSDIVTEKGLSSFTGQELRSRDALVPVQVQPLRELLDAGAIRPNATYLLPGDPELKSLLSSRLSMTSRQPVAVDLYSAGDESVIEITGNRLDVSECRFGLRTGQVRLVLDVGLNVVARIANPRQASAEAVDWALAPLQTISNRGLVVFSGTEALGDPDNLVRTAIRMRELDVIPGMVEFSVQSGDRSLANLLDYEVVRVHSITPLEYPNLSGQETMDRLLRAVSERNVRLLYLRPHLIDPQLESGTSLDFMRALRYRLESAGYSVGPASAYPRRQASMLGLFLPVMAAGVIASGLVIVRFVYPMGFAAQTVTALLACCVAAAIAFYDAVLARLLFSLVAALMAPAIAVLVSVIRIKALTESSSGRPIVAALRAFVAALAVAVAGGLVVAGFLSDRAFYVKAMQFLGVKASHTLPLALAGGLLWWYRYGDDFVGGRMQVSHSVRSFLVAPIRVWHVMIVAVAVIGFVIYLTRTGNTPFMGMPIIDQRLRELLESFLPVRPRTKEVFVGHPALLVSLYLLARSRGRCAYALVGVLVGMIGPISIINSFAHLHTPIALTLLRVALGAVMSLPVSLCAVALASVLLRDRFCVDVKDSEESSFG